MTITCNHKWDSLGFGCRFLLQHSLLIWKLELIILWAWRGLRQEKIEQAKLQCMALSRELHKLHSKRVSSKSCCTDGDVYCFDVGYYRGGVFRWTFPATIGYFPRTLLPPNIKEVLGICEAKGSWIIVRSAYPEICWLFALIVSPQLPSQDIVSSSNQSASLSKLCRPTTYRNVIRTNRPNFRITGVLRACYGCWICVEAWSWY